MAYVHIEHDVVIGDNCVLTNSVQIAGEIKIGDWVIIGGGQWFISSVKFGMNVSIAAMTPVISDIPPSIITIGVGMPAKYQGINYVESKNHTQSAPVCLLMGGARREAEYYIMNTNNWKE